MADDAGYTVSGGVGSITFNAWGAGTRQQYRYFWRPESVQNADFIYTQANNYTATSYFGEPLQGTYVCNCQLVDMDTGLGLLQFGAESVYVTAARVRPDDWAWQSTIEAGSPIQITAAEFLAFYNRIDEFLVYKGEQKYDFNRDSITKGAYIKADMINRALAAIGKMNMVGLPKYVESGNIITADLFIKMAATLNAIE